MEVKPINIPKCDRVTLKKSCEIKKAMNIFVQIFYVPQKTYQIERNMYFYIFHFRNMENPWKVQNIYDFNYFCCPECVYRSKEPLTFQAHALQNHILSRCLDFDKKIPLNLLPFI